MSEESSTFKVLYLNNDGGGFPEFKEVTPGTTVLKFITEQMAANDVDFEDVQSNYKIRVNRQMVTRDYVLQPGDRVGVSPLKVDGNAR